jgi:hypothetical protein
VALLPAKLRPARCNNGGVGVVLYYLQLAMVAVPQGYRTLAGKAAMMVGKVANVEQLASGEGSVCLVQGMTMKDQLVWHLFAPLMPMLLLVIGAALLHQCRSCKVCFNSCFAKGCCKGRCRRDSTRSNRSTASKASQLEGGGLTRPLLDDFVGEAGQQEDEEDGRERSDSSGSRGSSVATINSNADISSEAEGVVGGVACLVLLSFSSLSTAILKLLNCERVGDTLVLFHAGAHPCGVWQLPVYLLLVLMALVPLVPVCVHTLCLLPRSWRLAAWARTKRWPQYPVMQAIRRHALEPFSHEQQHWTAMLMLQRLATAACHALAPSELQTVLGVAIVSVMFLLLQALVRPYRVQWVNQLQLLSGWCLVMLSMLNAASSSVFTSLGVNVANTPFEALGAEADWMMFLLLWPPVIALALCTAYEMKALTLALTGLFGMSVGALIGGFAVSLLGAVVGALVGVLVGALVGTRSWWLRCCQSCRSRWWKKGDGGGGAERHAVELSEMGSVVSRVSSGGGDQDTEVGNEQLMAERRRHELEKAELLREKEQEKEQLLQEKEQLLREKEQEKEQLLQKKEQEKDQEKQRHKQEKEEEKQRHKQEKAVLLARLEELQEQGAQGAGTAARSGRKDLCRTFDPGEEGAA